MRFELAALALAAACSAPASPSPALRGGLVAGTRWMTAAQPWRTSESANTVVVLGATALFGGSSGWLAEVDLSSGLTVRETSIGEIEITDLLRLADGRVLALGFADKKAAGVVLDVATLAPAPIDLGAEHTDKIFDGVHGQVLPDGGVVVTSIGLPLAVYDPVTWKPRVVLSPLLDWKLPWVAEDSVIATREYTSFQFALTGGEPTKLPDRVLAAAADTVVAAKFEVGGAKTQARIGGGPSVVFRDLGYHSAIDPAGKRLADLIGDVVSVISLTDGTTVARFDLAPRPSPVGRLAFMGDRLLVVSDTLVTVIDLTSGYISPRGIAPSGSVSQLIVGDDGVIFALGAEAARFADGKLLGSVPVLGGTLIDNPPHHLAAWGTRTPSYAPAGVVPAVAIRTPAGDKLRSWKPERHTENGWLGTNGEVVLVLEWDSDKPSKAVRSDGKTFREIATYNIDTTPDDADPDAHVLAISRRGTVHLIDTLTGVPSAIRLRSPRCAEYPATVLERRGTRVSTSDEGEVFLWDRTTGAILGSLAYPEVIYTTIFVPGRAEVILPIRDGFVLWDPSSKEVRTAKIPHLDLVATSANARHLAISLSNGQIALADFAVARAALPVTKAVAAPLPPATCGNFDPFNLSEDDVDTSSSEGREEDGDAGDE